MCLYRKAWYPAFPTEVDRLKSVAPQCMHQSQAAACQDLSAMHGCSCTFKGSSTFVLQHLLHSLSTSLQTKLSREHYSPSVPLRFRKPAQVAHWQAPDGPRGLWPASCSLVCSLTAGQAETAVSLPSLCWGKLLQCTRQLTAVFMRQSLTTTLCHSNSYLLFVPQDGGQQNKHTKLKSFLLYLRVNACCQKWKYSRITQ